MKFKEITKLEFDTFGKKSVSKSFYQTSQYGTLMSRHGYKSYYVALVDEKDNIIVASLILLKNILFSYKFAYAPRGFLIDYTDINILKTFIKHLKEYLNRKKVLYLKIDPNIIHIHRNEKGLPTKKKNNGMEIIENLKNVGFRHEGFNLYFETLKPRWNAIVENAKDLEKKINKNVRNNLNNAKRRGIYIEKASTEDIKTFYNLINKKHTRKLNYYLDLYEIFGKFDMFDIFLAKIDITEFLNNYKDLYEKELIKNNEFVDLIQEGKSSEEVIDKKINSDKLLEQYKRELFTASKMLESKESKQILAATAIIKYEKEIFFLIDGINKKYNNYNANYLLKYELIKSFYEQGFKIFNLNGISGDFNHNNKYYGLYDFKIGFNSKIIEYIGEFDIVINTFNYITYDLIKKIEKKIFGLIKKN